MQSSSSVVLNSCIQTFAIAVTLIWLSKCHFATTNPLLCDVHSGRNSSENNLCYPVPVYCWLTLLVTKSYIICSAVSLLFYQVGEQWNLLPRNEPQM